MKSAFHRTKSPRPCLCQRRGEGHCTPISRWGRLQPARSIDGVGGEGGIHNLITNPASSPFQNRHLIEGGALFFSKPPAKPSWFSHRGASCISRGAGGSGAMVNFGHVVFGAFPPIRLPCTGTCSAPQPPPGALFFQFPLASSLPPPSPVRTNLNASCLPPHGAPRRPRLFLNDDATTAHVRQLVANINKKNHKASVGELNQALDLAPSSSSSSTPKLFPAWTCILRLPLLAHNSDS
jgi:hypothetical protein